MRYLTIVMVALLVGCHSSSAQWMNATVKGKPTEDDIVSFVGQGNQIEASGVSKIDLLASINTNGAPNYASVSNAAMNAIQPNNVGNLIVTGSGSGNIAVDGGDLTLGAPANQSVIIDNAPLVVNVDPTGDTHVGDRGYNDLRYAPYSAVATNAAQDAAIAAVPKTLEAGRGSSFAPIYLPTHAQEGSEDQAITNSVTHLSVIHEPTGWNGYPYWMAFTPFPNASREQPSIVASMDGVNWVVPNGLTNPVVSYAEMLALGHSWNADTDIVLNADKSEMWMYWIMAGGTTKLYRTKSTDGVTWTAPQMIIDGSVESGLGSASVIYDVDDDIYKMWAKAADNNDPTNRVVYRTSSDGVTWAAKTTNTVPVASSDFILWHLEVVKASGKYHMLFNEGTGGLTSSLYYWRSDDGLTWEGDFDPDIRAGTWDPVNAAFFDYEYDWAEQGFYRSAFVARPGDDLSFDVWANGIDVGGTIDTNSTPWLVGYIPTRKFDINTDKATHLTLADYLRLQSRKTELPLISDHWHTSVKTGSGGVNYSSVGGLYLYSGTTSNSHQVVTATSSPGQPSWGWISPGNTHDYIDWGNRFVIQAVVRPQNTAAGTTYRIEFGTGTAYVAALVQKGVSIEIRDGSVYGVCHDGTTETETPSLGSVTAHDTLNLEIDCDGFGNVTFTAQFENEERVSETLTNKAPVGVGAQYYKNLRVIAENINSPQNAIITVGKLVVHPIDIP